MMDSIKKIFAKPHNVLFAVSAAVFLQFLAAVVCFYAEAVIYFNFTGWTSYVYMAYCLAVCAAAAAVIFKGRADDVKVWLAGLLLYAFAEMMFYIKARYMASVNFYSWFSDEIFIFWDSQPMFRLHLCAAAVFMIYGVLFIIKKQKIYAALAGANLLLFGLVMFFMPESGSEYLAVDIDAGVFEVTIVCAAREAGILLYMLNMFVSALFKFYDYKEK